MENAIFITFDDKYSDYVSGFLRTIDEHYPHHPAILAYYDGRDPAVIQRLERTTRLRIMEYNENFLTLDNLDLGPVNSKKVFFRYILWTEAFHTFDKILHMDVDTVIFRPFDELFALTDFFAVNDFTPFGETLFKKEFCNDSTLKKLLLEDGIFEQPGKIPMLNAGVFLIPRRYRTRLQFDSLWRITQRYNKYTRFADQAAISLWALFNNVKFSSDVKYNFQVPFASHPGVFFNSFVANDLSLDEIRIAHYSWWKPNSIYYGKFKQLCKLFTALDEYHPY